MTRHADLEKIRQLNADLSTLLAYADFLLAHGDYATYSTIAYGEIPHLVRQLSACVSDD